MESAIILDVDRDGVQWNFKCFKIDKETVYS